MIGIVIDAPTGGARINPGVEVPVQVGGEPHGAVSGELVAGGERHGGERSGLNVTTAAPPQHELASAIAGATCTTSRFAPSSAWAAARSTASAWPILPPESPLAGISEQIPADAWYLGKDRRS